MINLSTHYRFILPFLFISCLSLNLLGQTLDSLRQVWEDPQQTAEVRLEAIQQLIWQGYMSRQFDSAYYYSELQYAYAQEQGIKTQMAYALRNKAIARNRQNKPQQAKELMLQNYEIWKELDNPERMSRALFALAHIEYSLGNIDQAINIYQQCLDLFKQEESLQGMSDVWNNLALMYTEQGNYPKALESFHKSLSHEEQQGNQANMIQTLNNIGIIYDRQGDLEKAFHQYQRAWELAKELEDERLMDIARYNIASIHVDEENYKEAIRLAEQSLVFREASKNQNGMGDALNLIGSSYLKLGDYSEALDYLERSLKIANETGSMQLQIPVMNNIGKVHLEQRDYSSAITTLQEAMKLAEALNILIYIRDVAENLFACYEQTGQYQQAIEMSKLYYHLQDSIQSEEAQRSVLRQEYQYEYEKQAFADSLSFVQEKAVTELSYQKQLANRNYLLFGSLGLALVGFVFLRYRQQIRNREKELELQQERERKEQLAELDAMKSRFFANISHEFRTPLTLILGQNEYLQSRIDDPVLDRNFDMLHRNGRKLLGLVNQVLDLSKLESGKLNLRQTPINLIPFLKNLFFSFESLADQKKISLHFHCNKESLISQVDPEKMERVFFNLLSNAIKFTPEHGKISFLLEQTGPIIRIGIQDTGIGIAQDQLAYVFDRFYQATSGEEHPSPGTGIGLALAKELVELHKGGLTVESETGKGSTFWVELPFLPESRPEPSAYSHQLEPLESSPAVMPNPPETSTHAEKILIVEDHPDVRSFLDETLKGFGYQVIQAENGHIGLQQAQMHQPDLIISDIMMPRMDGYEFANAIRGDVKCSHIPLILLTAKASDEDRITGLETGVDAYLTKPFNSKELQIRIRNLIEQRKKFQQQFSTSLIIKPEEISAVPMDQEFLSKVTEVIEANLTNDQFGVDHLSREVGMSNTHLNRKLNALIGQSTGKLIRSMRMQRAADLLQQQAGTVSDIAYDLGFSTPATFARAFRKQFGKSPSEYAQE